MTDAMQPQAPSPEHLVVLGELEVLARTHLLVHDLAVGKLILERFFAGDPVLFHSRNRHKESSFGNFVAACKDDLEALGQSEERLKKCIRAHIVWRALPPVVKDQLQLSHLVELARCTDPTTRARLALATTQSDWSVQQLRAAVTAAKDAGWDPVQPVPDLPDETAKPPLPLRRLTTRGEKLVQTAEEWLGSMEQRDKAALDTDQRARLLSTADRLALLAERLRSVAAD